MVRLRLVCVLECYHCDSWFQSHYGAIATRRAASAAFITSRFNPTMVRLRRFSVRWGIPILDEFQSHYGAIATFYPHYTPLPPTCQFQSHYGAIATSGNTNNNKRRRQKWFQSHYGAIATIPTELKKPLEKIRFNPTMVRLRPQS